MQTIVSQLDRAFRQAIQTAFSLDADPLISPSQNETFGDYQSNAAMGLAKQTKANPRAVAEKIKAALQLGDIATDVSIAGPGFINVKLDPAWVAKQLAQNGADPRIGVEQTQQPQTVVVDYSGPNIAKQMHVGHLRSTIIGDAIARTLAFRGDNVIRQNHLGDWGTQFGRVVLAMWYEAVFQRSGQRGKLEELMNRSRSGSTEAITDLVSQHQRFVEEDPDGTKYFLPYLRENSLDLEELERAYVFVSNVTGHAKAAELTIQHPVHGARTLAELPRLVTKFIQDPDLPDNEQERLAWEKARAVTLESCSDIYRRLGVQLADASIQKEPLERGESFYNPHLPKVVEDLTRAGIAQKSDGAAVVPVPGHENPLIIQKADGGYLYGTTDLAAIRFRVGTLGANRVVYLVDARQGQHFAQVFWTAKQSGWSKDASLEHASFGTMLGADGKPFKTRSGDTVKLKDLIDEAEERAAAVIAEKNPQLEASRKSEIAHAIGIGSVKYADLSKDRTSDYVFAWDRMLSFDGNTAPYLQNAYVRVHGIFRKAKAAGVEVKIDYGTIRLETPFELSLGKHILRLGEAVALVARELKPHHLCNYLYELANRYHVFFENCPVLQSEDPLRASRLALCDLTAKTLGLGLDLLGIEHPDQM